MREKIRRRGEGQEVMNREEESALAKRGNIEGNQENINTRGGRIMGEGVRII